MRKKIMAVILSCLTLLTLVMSAAWSPMRASAVSMDQMTSVAVELIRKSEGTYGSINPNDNGAVSVGILQWHAGRALDLMRSVAKADASAESTLGSSFYNEVMSATNWNTRTFSSGEASAASALLSSETGIAKQEALAASDVQGYIEVGQSYGITDPAVLVYYAELYNRGSGVAARILSAANTNGYANITLDGLHQTALAKSSDYYTSRLVNAYNTLVSLNWSTVTPAAPTEDTSSVADTGASSDDTQPAEITIAETPADFSESYAGDYIVDATSLNLRSAPDTGADKIGAIDNGETIAVISGNGSWAKVAYGEDTGYCARDYLVSAAKPTETQPVETTEVTETTEAVTETTVSETEATTEMTTETETVTAVETTTVQAYVEVEGVSDPQYATVYGDINEDGVVDTSDAVLLQRYLNGYVLLNDRQLANADCQRDDLLDSIDVTVIMQYAIDNLSALPVL